MSGSARPCVSVPVDLLDLYRAAQLDATNSAPPLSTLLQRAMVAELKARGVTPPRPPAMTLRTAAATAARSRRRLDEPRGR